MGETIMPDIVAEARRLAETARSERVELRITGGVAVSLHSPSGIPPALHRPYRDIDLVSGKKAGRHSARLLVEAGYEPNERFNAMNGHTRLVFYDRAHGRQVDVFVGEFRMCHTVPVAERLAVDPETIPLAELLLTKLQIVELNEKDLKDIWALVLEHEVADSDEDTINARVIAKILAGDWGLWRTSKGTVELSHERLAASELTAEQRAVIAERLAVLWERVEAAPKSLRWKSRARIGERTRWYEEPEEIAHRPD